MPDGTRYARFATQLADLGGGAHALATSMLGNRDDAADAVHDAIVKVLQAPQRFDASRGALKPWFLTVVRRRCLDVLRQRRDQSGDLDVVEDRGPTPEHAASAAQARDQLVVALGELTPDLREIVLLRDVNDLNYAEIAGVLGVPKGTVMSRLHRARLALRARLTEMESQTNDTF